MTHRAVWMRGFVVAALIGVLVVVAAVVSSNPPASRSAVNDAGVWVSNNELQAVGRVNTEINELNSVVSAPVDGVELMQTGRWVVSVDRTAGTATRIDAATARPVGSIALPDSGSALTIVGDHLVVAPTRGGPLWRVPLESFGSAGERLSAESSPNLDLGRDAVVTSTPAGGLFAVSPVTGAVLRSEPGTRVPDADRLSVDLKNTSGAIQVAATSTSWAVLDLDAGTVVTPRGVVEINRDVDAGISTDGDGVALQHTEVMPAMGVGGHSAETVLVSTRAQLLEIDLRTNRVRELSRGHSGVPARPVSVGGCEFAAWSDGSVWSRCTATGGTQKESVVAGMRSTARPILRTNADRVLLNDPQSGQIWAVQGDGAPIDGWDIGNSSNGDPATAVRADEPKPVNDRVADDQQPPQSRITVPVVGKSQSSWPMPVAAAMPTAGDVGEQTVAVPDGHNDSDGGVAQPSAPSTIPVPTPVTASFNGAEHSVTLTWQPFGGTGLDPIRGYFAQSLGIGNAAPQTGCAVLSPPSTDVRGPTGGEVHTLGLWTTTTFSGIADVGEPYGFVVWGFSRAGCVASATVWVTPPVAPGAVTAVEGEMADMGTDLEYRVTSVTPAASRYEVQRLDRVGTPVGQVAGVTSLGIVPRTLTGGPFGEIYTFQMRACNANADGGACGEWTTHAAPEASLTFALTDLSYSPETGMWTWAAMPNNGAVVMKPRCGRYSGPSERYTYTQTSCTGDVAVPSGDAWLQLRSGGSSRQFESN